MFDDWIKPITGTYKINPGDNLTKISEELEVPIDSLVSFNKLSNPDDIKSGQTLLYRREPGILEGLGRFIFGENEDSNKINEQINKNLLEVQNTTKEEEEDPEYIKLKRTIFKSKDINNFAKVMSTIYAHELKKRGLPLHNIDNLVKQDALESNYGISTRGNGYNLGGVKVFNDKEKLGTLYKDGFYYRNFKDLGDYVNYKLNLLENDYGGVISAPAGEFIDRIHGNNPNKKVYSGNKKHYINSFKGMISLSSALNKLRTSNNIQFKQYGGILLSPLDYLPDYSVKNIKVDPSIFNSWEAIKSDYIEPTITTKDEPLFNLSDYILATQPNYIIKNKKSTKEEKEELSKEEKSNNVEIPNPIPNSSKYSNKAQWVKDLTESYKRAEITNPTTLKYLIAQDALESGWGRSAQGNFNYGNLTTGSSWKGNYVQGRDKDANGNPISQKFRSYNSMDEYTKDKINFLTRLYDFNQDDDFQTFISKLTGSNKGHRRYAEARNYGESLTKVFQSLIDKHQGGGALNWTSEDLHNPVYKKGWTPESDKKALKNIKKGIQETRNKNFERNANIAYGIARLIPGPVGLATDITDIGYELYKNKSLPDSSTDAVKFGSWLLKRKLGRGIDLVNEMAKDMFGGYQKVANTVDTVQDSKQLYNTVNKHQEGGTLLFGNPETSEMLTYKMNDGSIKTVPNPRAGYVSGTDPVGQVVVEGAILNKPLGWALGKAINWAKNLLKNRAGNFTSSASNEITNSAEKIIKKEDLPSYAKPNWQGDAVELTKDRLREGGFDRLENNLKKDQELFYKGLSSFIPGKGNKIPKAVPFTKYSEELQSSILKSFSSNPKSSELNLRPTNWGGAYSGGILSNKKFGVFSDAPDFVKKGQTKSDIDAHEFVHHIYPLQNISPDESIFSKSRFPVDEILARGSQIKNYFGLKEGEELTGDMLRYASQNMVKDRGYDNNLTEFFSHITDYDKMAKYIDKYAPITVTAILYNDNN